MVKNLAVIFLSLVLPATSFQLKQTTQLIVGSNNQIGLLDSRYLWIQIPYNLSVYIPIFPLLRDPSPPLGDVTYTFILNPLGVSDVNLEDSHEISLEPGQYQWMSIGALEVSTPEKLQYFIIQFEGDCELELYAKGQSSMLYPKFPSPLDRVYPHPFTFAGSDREFHDSYVYSREVGQSSEQVVFGFRNPDDKTCSATVDAYLAELPKDEVKFDVDTSLKVKKHRFSLMKFSSSYLASDNVGKTATMTVDKLKVELVPLDMYVGWGIPPVESNIHKVFYGNSDFVFQLEKPIPWMVVGVVPAASGNIMLSAYLGEVRLQLTLFLLLFHSSLPRLLILDLLLEFSGCHHSLHWTWDTVNHCFSCSWRFPFQKTSQ